MGEAFLRFRYIYIFENCAVILFFLFIFHIENDFSWQQYITNEFM